jgi:hypothetical protein
MNWTSNVMVTSSPTRIPPVSSAVVILSGSEESEKDVWSTSLLALYVSLGPMVSAITVDVLDYRGRARLFSRASGMY